MDSKFLSEIIKDALVRRNLACLPGFGAFTTVEVPAYFSDKAFTINPPYRKVIFTADVTDDKALADRYAADNSITRERALEIVGQQVRQIRIELQSERTSVFPGLGNLRITRDGKVFFVPDEHLNIFPEFDLLEPVSLRFMPPNPQQDQLTADAPAAKVSIADNPAVGVPVAAISAASVSPVGVQAAEASASEIPSVQDPQVQAEPSTMVDAPVHQESSPVTQEEAQETPATQEATREAPSTSVAPATQVQESSGLAVPATPTTVQEAPTPTVQTPETPAIVPEAAASATPAAPTTVPATPAAASAAPITVPEAAASAALAVQVQETPAAPIIVPEATTLAAPTTVPSTPAAAPAAPAAPTTVPEAAASALPATPTTVPEALTPTVQTPETPAPALPAAPTIVQEATTPAAPTTVPEAAASATPAAPTTVPATPAATPAASTPATPATPTPTPHQGQQDIIVLASKTHSAQAERVSQLLNAGGKKKGMAPWLVALLILLVAAALFFGGLALLGRFYPELIDPLLYTKEELMILNSQL